MLIKLQQSDQSKPYSINIQREGSGPTLLLIHGFPLDSRMWNPQMDGLKDDFDLLVPDLRGFGRSERMKPGWTVADFANDLNLLLDELGIEKVIVCGLSLGGYIAFEFWAAHSAKVAGLILCCTRAAADDETTSRARRFMAERVRHDGVGFVKSTMLPKLVARPTLYSDLQPNPETFFEELDPDSIAWTQEAMSCRRDFTGAINQINCPVQVFAGGEDGITPADQMRVMAEGIPGATFHVIENAGHLLPLERPDEFNSLVLERWSRGS